MKLKCSAIEQVSLYKAPKKSPGYLLWKVSTLWRSKVENALKVVNLTHPQFVILASIDWLTKNNTKVAQVDVSAFTGLDPNTTSQILRVLEGKKLITRVRTVNERSKNPCLTTVGSQVLIKALPIIESIDKQFFEVLDSEQHNNLLGNFVKLLALQEGL